MNMAQPPSGALGTAVDRMSFAHDIVMISDSTIIHAIDSMQVSQILSRALQIH